MGRPQEIAALDRALAALAAPSVRPDGARVVRPFGRRSALASLLAALDEAVMPQTLRVTDARGATLKLDLANRRLLAVRPGPGATIAPCAPDAADEAGLDRLCDCLADFAAGGPLRIAPEALAGTSGRRGVAVADLAARRGETLAPGPVPEPAAMLEHAFAAHPETLLAWLAVEEGASDGDGDPAALADLDALAAALAACPAALPEGTLATALRPDHALALLHSGGVTLGIAALPEAGDALAATLQQMLLGWA
ncbi:MAG: hypothetical protein V2I65_08205 [Paracoccaceae bacterium]|jgi:hypothetical protein|nr:hypothetical protein [Paracoccaceae bacterium]